MKLKHNSILKYIAYNQLVRAFNSVIETLLVLIIIIIFLNY